MGYIKVNVLEIESSWKRGRKMRRELGEVVRGGNKEEGTRGANKGSELGNRGTEQGRGAKGRSKGNRGREKGHRPGIAECMGGGTYSRIRKAEGGRNGRIRNMRRGTEELNLPTHFCFPPLGKLLPLFPIHPMTVNTRRSAQQHIHQIDIVLRRSLLQPDQNNSKGSASAQTC